MHYVPPGLSSVKDSVAIDFDGVMHNDCHGWGDGTCYGEPLPGSLEAIRDLALTYDIIIFSAKAREDRPLVDGKTGVDLIKEWCVRNKVEHLIKDITSVKPRSILYIDDKAIRFTNWEDTKSQLKQLGLK